MSAIDITKVRGTRGGHAVTGLHFNPHGAILGQVNGQPQVWFSNGQFDGSDRHYYDLIESEPVAAEPAALVRECHGGDPPHYRHSWRDNACEFCDAEKDESQPQDHKKPKAITRYRVDPCLAHDSVRTFSSYTARVDTAGEWMRADDVLAALPSPPDVGREELRQSILAAIRGEWDKRDCAKAAADSILAKFHVAKKGPA